MSRPPVWKRTKVLPLPEVVPLLSGKTGQVVELQPTTTTDPVPTASTASAHATTNSNVNASPATTSAPFLSSHSSSPSSSLSPSPLHSIINNSSTNPPNPNSNPYPRLSTNANVQARSKHKTKGNQNITKTRSSSSVPTISTSNTDVNVDIDSNSNPNFYRILATPEQRMQALVLAQHKIAAYTREAEALANSISSIHENYLETIQTTVQQPPPQLLLQLLSLLRFHAFLCPLSSLMRLSTALMQHHSSSLHLFLSLLLRFYQDGSMARLLAPQPTETIEEAKQIAEKFMEQTTPAISLSTSCQYIVLSILSRLLLACKANVLIDAIKRERFPCESMITICRQIVRGREGQDEENGKEEKVEKEKEAEMEMRESALVLADKFSEILNVDQEMKHETSSVETQNDGDVGISTRKRNSSSESDDNKAWLVKCSEEMDELFLHRLPSASSLDRFAPLHGMESFDEGKLNEWKNQMQMEDERLIESIKKGENENEMIVTKAEKSTQELNDFLQLY